MRLSSLETLESQNMRLIDKPSRPKAGASLDHRTSFVEPQAVRVGEYSVAVYPDAAEAVICHVPPRLEPSNLVDEGPTRQDLPDFGEVDADELEQENWERSTRRAFSESRRYFVANRLRFMWVLTFTGAGLHGPDGREECMLLVAAFVRRFRAQFGVMPYWASPELHPGGHGWHVNFFVPKRLSHRVMQAIWSDRSSSVEGVSTGMVHVSDKTKDPRVVKLGLSFVEALRMGALYGCKYASKDWSREQILPGEHRFIAGQGFKPRKIQVRAFTESGGIAEAVAIYGQPPHWCWRSYEVEDWDAPDVVCLRWAHPSTRGNCDE